MLGKGVWMRGICVERKNKEVKKNERMEYNGIMLFGLVKLGWNINGNY